MRRRVGLALLLMAACPASSQVKRTPAPQDFDLWHSVSGPALSPDGKWASFGVDYREGPDTLFVASTVNEVRWAFPGAAKASFSPDGALLVVQGRSGLDMRVLPTGNGWELSGVKAHGFMKGGVVVLRKAGGLAIFDHHGNSMAQHADVTDFAVDGEEVLFTTGSTVGVLSRSGRITVWATGCHKASVPLRMPMAGGVAWVEERPGAATGLRTVFWLDPRTGEKKQCGTIGGREVVERLGFPVLRASADGKRLVVATLPVPRQQAPVAVEVWDTSSPQGSADAKRWGKPEDRPWPAVWIPREARASLVASARFPSVYFLPGLRHAVLYDPIPEEPDFRDAPSIDGVLLDLETGRQDVAFTAQESNGTFGASPNGRYFHRFDGKKWLVHDVLTGTWAALEVDGAVQWCDRSRPGYARVFQQAYWSEDSGLLVVGSDTELFFFTPRGKLVRRWVVPIGARCKIPVSLYPARGPLSSDALMVRSVPLAQGFVVQVFDEVGKGTGYAFASLAHGIRPWLGGPVKRSQIVRAGSGRYAFLEERADQPPRVVTARKGQGPEVLFESNRHHARFAWHSTELVHYFAPDGTPLSGVLLKPAGYQGGVRYPMVVQVYEEQSSTLHTYRVPSLYDTAAFSAARYAADGYLVLLPDIRYRMGDPGLSALECVEAAVGAVKDKGLVDPHCIALVGHSFGGYEALFIATQSKTFATVVAGSGIYDLLAFYLQPDTMGRSSNFGRIEGGQIRIPHNPFTEWEPYGRNDPMTHIAGLAVPVLHWSGNDDDNVSRIQGMALHLALYRLGRRNVYLNYPAEGHILGNPENQLDAGNRVKEWLDHYLKT